MQKVLSRSQTGQAVYRSHQQEQNCLYFRTSVYWYVKRRGAAPGSSHESAFNKEKHTVSSDTPLIYAEPQSMCQALTLATPLSF
jgi:hypothetical protein